MGQQTDPINFEKNLPVVSVFMSVYNGWPYLKDAVESVLNQSFENFEFVIVNDGSTDETKSYLDSLTDPRLKIIHQENQGLGTPLNKWMQKCKGTYIMRLDADDLCHPQRLEKQMNYLEAHPEVILVGCQLQFFSKDQKGAISTLPQDHQLIVDGMLKGWHTLSHPTIMWRKSLLTHIDGYAFAGAGEDWSFLLDAARFGKLAVLPEMLYLHRLHKGSNAWKGVERTFAGLAYAKRRYQSFMLENKEYPVEKFLQEWEKKGLIFKTYIKSKCIAAIMYRKAMIDQIEKRKFQSYIRILLAALFDPNKTVGAIQKKMMSTTLKRTESI